MTGGPLEVDARGQRCPLPVITLALAVRDLPGGSEVALLATDPATRYDIPAWCRMRGHELVSPPPATIKELPDDQGTPEPGEGPVLRFVVRLAPGVP